MQTGNISNIKQDVMLQSNIANIEYVSYKKSQ